MNGPIRIYRTKRIVNYDLPVNIPNCMYKMKNIHSPRNGLVDGSADHVSPPAKKLDISDQNNHQSPGMAELVVRQDEILKQLDDLKKQILSIKSDLKITKTTPTKHTTFSPAGSLTINNLPDIVINACPTNPPYSLEIVQRLLQDTLSVIVISYLHSSVASLSESAKKLRDSLVNFKPKSGVTVMNVRLIWKNINSNTELLVSHIPIAGEVNLLRFISRVTRNNLSYDSESNWSEIDSLLDLCHLLVRAKTKTERSSCLQTLSKSLSKSQWLLGKNNVSVADVAAYSAVKQCTSLNEISASLGKWYQRCEVLV